MMHLDIKRFSLDGAIREKNIEVEKKRMEGFLESSMTDDGFVRVLDLDPQWSIVYDFENELYDFKLSLYGVKVKEAWAYSGIMGGVLVKRYSNHFK